MFELQRMTLTAIINWPPFLVSQHLISTLECQIPQNAMCRLMFCLTFLYSVVVLMPFYVLYSIVVNLWLVVRNHKLGEVTFQLLRSVKKLCSNRLMYLYYSSVMDCVQKCGWFHETSVSGLSLETSSNFITQTPMWKLVLRYDVQLAHRFHGPV